MEIQIDYINGIMTEVNDFSDELYESLADADNKKVVETCKNLIKVLHDIKRTHDI
jgi:pyruvate-formate lyase-activating enzyme